MKPQYRALGGYSTLGIEIVLSMLVGFLGGRFIDHKIHTDPYLSVIGFVLGIGAAGKAIFRTMRAMNVEAAREEREQGNPAPLFDRPSGEDRSRTPRSPASPPGSEAPSDDHDQDRS